MKSMLKRLFGDLNDLNSHDLKRLKKVAQDKSYGGTQVPKVKKGKR